jgi:hypothetical protein
MMEKIRIGFSSFPDYSGNSKALYKALLLKDLPQFELVWFVKSEEMRERLLQIGVNAVCDKDESFEEEFYKSKILFITHDDYIKIKRRKSNFYRFMAWNRPKEKW